MIASRFYKLISVAAAIVCAGFLAAYAGPVTLVCHYENGSVDTLIFDAEAKTLDGQKSDTCKAGWCVHINDRTIVSYLKDGENVLRTLTIDRVSAQATITSRALALRGSCVVGHKQF
jgi:hypothetical protein